RQAGERVGVGERVPQRDPGAERVAEHTPAVDSQPMSDGFEVGDEVVDGQAAARGQRIGAERTALVDGDEPKAGGELSTYRTDEVVGTLTWSAVHEQDRWR